MSTQVLLSISKTVNAGRYGVFAEGKLSQGSDQSSRTANAKEHAIDWLIQKASEGTVMFFKRVFSGEGATANFRVILN